MATNPDKVVKSVTHYAPELPPDNPNDLPVYVVTELKRLADILLNQATFRLERVHSVPGRPRVGDIRYFDGTDANPVSGGEGIYFYNGTTWVKL